MLAGHEQIGDIDVGGGDGGPGEEADDVVVAVGDGDGDAVGAGGAEHAGGGGAVEAAGVGTGHDGEGRYCNHQQQQQQQQQHGHYLVETGPSLTVGNVEGEPARVFISQRFVLYFLPQPSRLRPKQNPKPVMINLMQWFPASAMMIEYSCVKVQCRRSTLLGVCSSARAPSPAAAA